MEEYNGDVYAGHRDWENNVDEFFKWMLNVNGYFESSWVFQNLKKLIITKADLTEWYIFFCEQYAGDFDYIDQCSISFIRKSGNKNSIIKNNIKQRDVL